MSKFPNIEDPRIRAVLEGNATADDVEYAVVETVSHSLADLLNPMLSDAVLRVREQAVEDAVNAWDNDCDMAETISALKTFWTN